jgi:hypothetical protein
MARKKPEHQKPTFAIQISCIIALVILSFIDGFFAEFEVNNWVYAIMAGILFGVANIRNVIGGGDK